MYYLFVFSDVLIALFCTREVPSMNASPLNFARTGKPIYRHTQGWYFNHKHIPRLAI